MLKKSVFLAITLLLAGAVITPLVQAQDMAKLEALEKELEQLEAKADRGQLTPADIQRMQQIQQEIIQAMGPYGNMFQFQPQGSPNTNSGDQQLQQIQQMQQQTLQQNQQMQPRQQQQRLPGETSGWPSASIFAQCNLPNLRQPAGTTVSYTYNSQARSLAIYVENGTQNIVNELARAIEADGKATYKDVPNGYFVLPAPSGVSLGRNGHYQVTVQLDNGRVEVIAGARFG
jgi:YD repeat-containing protein